MHEQLKSFLRYLDVERGYSANTINTYTRILADFLQFLRKRRKTLMHFGKQELGEYVLILCQERHNSSKSIRLKLQAIKSFFAFMRKHTGELKKNPLANRTSATR